MLVLETNKTKVGLMVFGLAWRRGLWLLVAALSLLIGMEDKVMAGTRIQELKTPAGITVWLVESHQIPMVSVEVAFRVGGAFDPADKPGLANFTASLLDEGAGDMDSRAYKLALENLGTRLGAGADSLDISVNMDTLSENLAASMKLLGLAVRAPRFDDEPVKRIREAILAGLKREKESPGAVATRAAGPAIYGEHPYARMVSGDEEAVATFDAPLARGFHQKGFTRANMVVSVVGDVSPAALFPLIDDALAGLPVGDKRLTVAATPRETVPHIVRVQKPIPQANVIWGHVGVDRHDKDYFPLFVMNSLLGTVPLANRLYDDVREKHGLVYDVRSVLIPMPGKGEWFVSLQTSNATAQKALDLVRANIKDIQTKPVSEQEYQDVIDYLVGSFPLRLDTNSKILGYLTSMQMEGLGIDYLDTWTAKVKAVSREDILRVAKTYLKPEGAALVVVGDKEALEAK